MKIGYMNATADDGKHFVVTEFGYHKTPDRVKKEREIGKPIKGFEREVPKSWVEKGYVKEASSIT